MKVSLRWLGLLASTMSTLTLTSYNLNQTGVSFYGHTLTEKGIQTAVDKLESTRNMKSPSYGKELQTTLKTETYLNLILYKVSQHDIAPEGNE